MCHTFLPTMVLRPDPQSGYQGQASLTGGRCGFCLCSRRVCERPHLLVGSPVHVLSVLGPAPLTAESCSSLSTNRGAKVTRGWEVPVPPLAAGVGSPKPSGAPQDPCGHPERKPPLLGLPGWNLCPRGCLDPAALNADKTHPLSEATQSPAEPVQKGVPPGTPYAHGPR